jgi:hypothetical protein
VKRVVFLIALLASLMTSLSAQELECAVRVEAPKAQTIEPRIFRTMEAAIYQFMNGRKWTNDKFLEQEKIKCSIIINITESPQEGDYKATFIVQSQRPVYKSGYNTAVFSHNDKECDFEYFEFQQLDFINNGYTNNLTSLLAFYAYIIIGYDYATFSSNGGLPHFLQAKAILDNIPQNERAKFKGWNAFDGIRNRFYLIDGLLNPRFKVFQQVLYTYHYSGLDRMHNDIPTGREAITSTLKDLDFLNNDNPNNMLLRLFFVAKADELKNIYSGASPSERGTVVDMLTKLDPLNAEKYRDLLKL